MISQRKSTRVRAPDLTSAPSESTLVPNKNDGLVPKPNGRSKPDTDKDGADKFVERKVPFIVSTFNTRTLTTIAKKQELVYEAHMYSIDIICLQEHRNIHDEPLMQETFDGYTLITSSAWKNKRNAAIGGVGVLLSPRALKACTSIVKCTKRIMKVTLLGNPVTTVLCCYSPHNELPEEDVVQFYQELSTIINPIPAHNLLLIGGDFNAQLGPTDSLFTLHKNTNRNGKHMKDFMEQCSLVATNTRFQNRTGRLWTHRRPTGYLVQLDYILARKKWINSIKNSRAYNSFEGVKSDHRIVSCNCQISYRKSKVPDKDPMKQIDWRKVAGDGNLREEFTVAVHNRFNTLCDELEDKNISVVYDTLTTANRNIALEMLPKKRKKTPTFASNKTVTKAREELKNAAQKHQSRSTRNTERNLDAASLT